MVNGGRGWCLENLWNGAQWCLIPGGEVRYPPFSMRMWGAHSPTLNLETAENKGGEKSGEARLASMGHQEIHSHLIDE